MINNAKIAFLGAGGIAKSHAYALDALKYYYPDTPNITKVLVASPTPKSREGFAARFGFKDAIPPEKVWQREGFDTLYILGTNETHTPQLLKTAKMSNIKRIYIEKPLAISSEEIQQLENLAQSQPDKIIMVGFQFLQKSAIRQALAQWRSGAFGEPIHFRADYLHSSYLDPAYRQKHPDRLLPIPQQGVVADMGAHIFSLLTAFLGDSLVVRDAIISGQVDDVDPHSDLCTTILLQETTSGAAGTMVASRISQGTGDFLSLELRGTKGALLYSTAQPDFYETYLPHLGWQRHEVMSNYPPVSTFPSHYTPSGWLRALVHNHYLFLGGEHGISVIPDLQHGITVQRLIQQVADKVWEA